MTATEQRARDARIAERIFRWTEVIHYGDECEDGGHPIGSPPDGVRRPVYCYHSDEVASASLKDKIARKTMQFHITLCPDREDYIWCIWGWKVVTCIPGEEIKIESQHPDFKTALCLFAEKWIERRGK